MASELRTTTLEGTGLHAGCPSSVTFEWRPGPVVFRTDTGEATIAELEVLRTDRGVQVACPRIGLDVDSVAHLFAALGGLGIRDGVAIEVRGGEVPLADGGALAFAERLLGLSLPARGSELVVRRAATFRLGESRYDFAPAERVALDVTVEFEAKAIGVQRAAWDGTRAGFVEGIAWARTFGFLEDGAALHAAGRARGVDFTKVMVLGVDGRVEPPGAPAREGEMARHKLLDLVGDLYVHGGPPRGRLSASRPGHAATHRVVGLAIAQGIIGPAERAPGLVTSGA